MTIQYVIKLGQPAHHERLDIYAGIATLYRYDSLVCEFAITPSQIHKWARRSGWIFVRAYQLKTQSQEAFA